MPGITSAAPSRSSSCTSPQALPELDCGGTHCRLTPLRADPAPQSSACSRIRHLPVQSQGHFLGLVKPSRG